MKDLREYARETASPTMEAFADFAISEIYGGTLPAGIDEASFREGIRLGGSTRMFFQKSDFWKADERNYLVNAEARRAEKAAAKAEAAKASAAKAAARAAKAVADANEAAAKAAARLAALTGADEADEAATGADEADEAATDEAATDEADEAAPRRSRRSRRAA